MTTNITVKAHTTTTKEVEIDLYEDGKLIKTTTIQDGETFDNAVFDGREVRVREVIK